jgi:hypothetical protein
MSRKFWEISIPWDLLRSFRGLAKLMAQGHVPKSNSFRETEGSDGDYLMMEELDEENINWGKLLTRAFCLLLLVIIIGCVSPDRGIFHAHYGFNSF